MKLLRVFSSIRSEGGGPIEGSKQISRFLVEDGHQVQFFSLDDPDDPEVREFPYPVHALGPAQSYYRYSSRALPWLKEHLGEYDAVLVHGLWQYQCSAVYQARRHAKNGYFAQTHGMLDPWFNLNRLKYYRKLPFWYGHLRAFLAQANEVWFTTEEEKIVSRTSFPGYRANERVVPYGTSAPSGDAEAQTEAFLQKHPELRDKRTLLYLSRIHPKKGVDLLLRAFAKTFGEADAPVVLVMAGPDDGDYPREMKALAGELGIADRVTWTGMLKGDLKYGAFHHAKAFVLPSHQENFGIAVAEALACAKPVFISNKVNIWREVERDGAGFVANDDQPGTDHLLSTFREKSDEALAQIGENAYRCFEANFEIGRAAREMARILDPNQST